MSKQSRTKWIEEMINGGSKKEEVIAAILKGNKEKEIPPMEGANVEMFAELNYRKIFKKMKKNV